MCSAKKRSNLAMTFNTRKQFPLWEEPNTSLSPLQAKARPDNNLINSTTRWRTDRQYVISVSIWWYKLLSIHPGWPADVASFIHDRTASRCSVLFAWSSITHAFLQSLNHSFTIRWSKFVNNKKFVRDKRLQQKQYALPVLGEYNSHSWLISSPLVFVPLKRCSDK